MKHNLKLGLTILCLVLIILNFTFAVIDGNKSASFGWACAFFGFVGMLVNSMLDSINRELGEKIDAINEQINKQLNK